MKLFFRKQGQGPALFILHGLFGNCDNWMTHSRELSKYFTVYAIDQRNHGQSPHSDVFTYEAMANDLLELLNDEHIEKAIFMGHSMGGKTLLEFVQLYPERVERMVIVDIGPKYYPSHHDDVINAFHSVDLEKITSRKEADEALSKVLDDAGLRQFLLKNLFWEKKPDGSEHLAWRMNLPVLERESENVGKELFPKSPIDLPFLFIRGQHSSYILDEDWLLIQKYFTHATLATIPNAGHWVQAENPQGFMKELLAWLEV